MRTVSLDQRVLRAEQDISSLSTILLDSNMNYIGTISWQKALTMVWKGSVNVLSHYMREVDGELEEVRVSAGTELATGERRYMGMPFIASLIEHVYDPYAAYLKSDSDIAMKRAILVRDSYICAYQHRLGKKDKKGKPDGCTYKADTVDHIIPKSKGGPNTWTNLIAACKWCNNKKADRTPKEAGMKLLWEATKYDGEGPELQQQIWDYLMLESGAE